MTDGQLTDLENTIRHRRSPRAALAALALCLAVAAALVGISGHRQPEASAQVPPQWSTSCLTITNN